jgi:hypothetical protein
MKHRARMRMREPKVEHNPEDVTPRLGVPIIVQVFCGAAAGYGERQVQDPGERTCCYGASVSYKAPKQVDYLT